MFYFAHFSILLLGYSLASEWSRGIYRAALRRPEAHLFGATCISLGVYFLVAGLPYFLLWRSYKKALVSFVSPEDEVLVSERRGGRRPLFFFFSFWLSPFGFVTFISFFVI